jgi:hydrogenase-1 operon protein HyaF
MKPIAIPVVALGPGSHTGDEAVDYLPMPSAMQTFRPPVLPEPEDIQSRAAARRALERIAAALDCWLRSGAVEPIELSALAPLDLALINQVLGEGEVSARIEHAAGPTLIQESVFAGVWRIRQQGPNGRPLADRIEVAAFPAAVHVRRGDGMPAPARPELGPGLASAPALLTEILDRAGAEHHVINLTLLPFTPDDGDYLDRALGRGPVSILSRGYGNCRITATALDRVWWVQYFNSQDVLILNTIEIADVPEIALAADEDIVDSRERLADVLAWLVSDECPDPMAVVT